jgi:predicted ABC-type ATPase
LLRTEKQLAANQDFIIESTLSGRTLRNFLAKARAAGYSITIVFIYLNSADTSVARVKQRVRRGGHDVPEVDIRRRFPRACSNFWQMYRQIADQWVVIYNAGSGFDEIAFGFPGEFSVSDEELFEVFLKYAEHSSNG